MGLLVFILKYCYYYYVTAKDEAYKKMSWNSRLFTQRILLNKLATVSSATLNICLKVIKPGQHDCM
jgi:hypothetical protein